MPCHYSSTRRPPITGPYSHTSQKQHFTCSGARNFARTTGLPLPCHYYPLEHLLCRNRTRGKCHLLFHHRCRLNSPNSNPLRPLSPRLSCFVRYAPQPTLVSSIVQKAACSGWGKLYLTDSTFDDNPWNELPSFWNALVDAVSSDALITCPDSAESRMRIMVPFLMDPAVSSDGAFVAIVCRCSVRGSMF